MHKFLRVITPMQDYTRSVDVRSIHGISVLMGNVYRASAE